MSNEYNFEMESSSVKFVNTAVSKLTVLKIFYILYNAFAHWLVGAVTCVCSFFAFKNGIPQDATSLHIFLCVIGYQLLMAEAILTLSPHNGWSANLRLIDKRRAHVSLQIIGSGLALAGGFIKAIDTERNWDTLHGQLAFIAMILTVACFFNGLTSIYPNKIKCISPKISKMTHICFGTTAYGAASISLCFGFDKDIFKHWLGPGLTATIIIFTAVLAGIVIINPVIDLYYKVKNEER